MEFGDVEDCDIGASKDCDLLWFRTRRERKRFTGVCSGAQVSVDLGAKTLRIWGQYIRTLPYQPQHCLLGLNCATLPCFLMV